MSPAGRRVAIVGGSIAGCAAALALSRADCHVTVYERTSGALRDRGSGIGMPADLYDDLVSRRYLDAGTPVCRYTHRVWYVRDGRDEHGRVLAAQAMPIACQNWSILWRALRAKVPDTCYHAGTQVTRVQAGDSGAVLTLPAGRGDTFDVIIGADGHQSMVRSVVAPGARPTSSGYALWRGTCPEDLLSGPTLGALEKSMCAVAFPGGHAIAYFIPDANRPKKRLLNWGVYIVPPAGLLSFQLIPPGAVDDRLSGLLEDVLARHFPPLWANAFRLTSRERVSVQPICDATTPAYAHRRFVLTGDAGATSRPHTGSGATAALQDALALERWYRTAADWDMALDGYSRERCTAGNAQVRLGRRLGQVQVTGTPDWRSMSPADFERWWSPFSSDPDLIYR